jgi:uncharacterized LabA/DUF88 family protein
MRSHANNAYIDGANLHTTIRRLGWELDYGRFRVWLQEKYDIKDAYLFLGFISTYADLYRRLRESGFILIFKEVVFDDTGKAKGNCDADLVLQVVCDSYEKKFEKAVIVSSDGDYVGLVKFLKKRNQIATILSPAREDKCSLLLKRTNVPIVYLDDKRSVIAAR